MNRVVSKITCICRVTSEVAFGNVIGAPASRLHLSLAVARPFKLARAGLYRLRLYCKR